MGSMNGFGTSYYGWNHTDDGTSTATLWFCLSWVPVFPLMRQRLKVLTDFNNEEINSELGGLIVSQSNYYEILERLPTSYSEILITFLKTYIGIPLILFGPMVVLAIIMKFLKLSGVDVKPNTMIFNVFIGGIFLSIINFLWQCVRFIRKARGWQNNHA